MPWRDGTVYAVLTVTASTEGIDQVLWMFNPEKIATVSVLSQLTDIANSPRSQTGVLPGLS